MLKKNKVAYYLCDELDCGFKYTYKERRGPSANNPLHVVSVRVLDLNKSVQINLAGFEEKGYDKMLEMGHEDYIFPVNLFIKPYSVQVKISKSGSVTSEMHERWMRLVASYKGEEYVSKRKKYVLVSTSGEIVKRKIMNQDELTEAVNYSKKWQERNPDKEPLFWHLASKYEEFENVGNMHFSLSQ